MLKGSCSTAAICVFISFCGINVGVFGQIIRFVIPRGRFICPGDELIFSCVTRGSQTIAWTSDEYIEPGTELDFGVFNTIGDTRTSPVNESTVATLINNTNENGVILLESELRIIVSPQVTTFTIACSIDNGNKKNISLQLLDVEMPQSLTAILINTTRGPYCEIQLGWIAQSDISFYKVFINGENVSNVNNNNQGLILKSYPTCSCKVNQVSVTGVDHCGHEGQSSVTTMIEMDQEPIFSPMCEIATTTESGNINKDENTYEMATIGLTVVFIISLAVIVILVIAVICLVHRLRKIRNDYPMLFS